MEDDKKVKHNHQDNLLSDMVAKKDDDRKVSASAALMLEPQKGSDQEKFDKQLSAVIDQTANVLAEIEGIASDPVQAQSWDKSIEVIKNFKPVPWFIWRISNYVLGSGNQSNKINEGFVLGLRRLLFAAASDPIIGGGEKVNDLRKALKCIPADLVAAVSVVHAVCRRLPAFQFERIWRPILDDAILRSQIGWSVGCFDETFGTGRGMLAGFAGRAGLVILISTGDLEQARSALDLLANGKEISEVGMTVYKCNPLQVSAMMLSASGCGNDAAHGIVSYAFPDADDIVTNDEQRKWLAAFSITENIRIGKVEDVKSHYWEILNIDESAKNELVSSAKKMIRRGHGWDWLL